MAYYNENDPHAAAWLRELITRGLIAKGAVDDRSIADVSADDVRGHGHCHWFEGIGGWSYALRLAGWPGDLPVWTGSCPCQPFSAGGKGAEFDDERHLWPTWFRLIRECRPATIFGEQVGGPAGLAWLDVVLSDLEGIGYAVAAANLPAACVGAPHIRQRLFFVASGSRRVAGELAYATGDGRSAGIADERRQARGDAERGSAWMGHADGRHASAERQQCGWEQRLLAHGDWSDCEWIACRDGKWRPTQRGLFPLVDGLSARVGRGGDSGLPVDPLNTSEGRVMRLRGYGNAIVPQVAAEFIRAFMDALP